MHSLLTHQAALEHARDMLARADRRRLARLAAVTRPSRSNRLSANRSTGGSSGVDYLD